ncbi:MAG: DUF6174 domain-containing protein [Gemmatimonadaceae bacterium]
MLSIARRSILAVALIALVACETDPLEPLGLVRAHARWVRANVDSYEITVRRLCFCGFVDPVRVTVSGGVIVSRVNIRTGEPVPANIDELFPDVPGLFTIVVDARENAADVHTEYDAAYGFPTVISIDWRASVADDEIAYVAEDFAVRLE